MKSEVCTSFDSYLRNMTHNDITMTWQAKMSDNSNIWGDYERPGYKKCWDRVTLHCKKNKIVPVSIKLYMFGMPEYVFFEDSQGLDGVSIVRGCSREQSLDGSHKDFQFLAVSLLSPECDKVEVRKFIWPETELEPEKEFRIPTENTITNMIFKHDSQKAKHPEIQKYFHGAAV